MFVYILRRLFYTLPIVFGISLIIFILFNIIPGNPALQLAGRYATQADLQRIEQELGLDQPLPKQYVFFLKQIVTFDYGKSYMNRQDINAMFWKGVPASLMLTIPAFLGTFVWSLVFSVLIAYWRGRLIDRAMLVFCIVTMSLSVLFFIIGGQYYFAFKLKWFPIHGFAEGLEGFRYVALPCLIWILLGIGPNVRLYRAVFLEELAKDYVRTARSKGLGTRVVLFKHVLKNAMIPIITNEIVNIPFLLTGSFLLESFFGIPGVGDMLIVAISNNDYPVIKAFVILGSMAYVVFNLISDILYTWVDPRVRLS